MGKPSDAMIAKTFELFYAAAVAGERAPMNRPFGPADADATKYLVQTDRIRVEIFRGNWRQIFIKIEGGEISTAPCPAGGKPYTINGRSVSGRAGCATAELDVKPRAGSPSRDFTTAMTVPSVPRLIQVAPLPPKRVDVYSFGDPQPERSELARRLAEQNRGAR